MHDFDREAAMLTINFVRHGDNGSASAFTERAQTGQTHHTAATICSRVHGQWCRNANRCRSR
ncbi:hypothetical protein C7N83_11320 [Neisseria iguanae]|uniref:Siderophore-interacting FAD-binding domain-containing protein n=2 Tax=Neisseria iguanae TaxID=90242 RepID=A0A2P7TXY5_9NEIS|nr:hypothetical protein C7N83_11320 [Neisseria iguanae]